jgi:hypothetical protein
VIKSKDNKPNINTLYDCNRWLSNYGDTFTVSGIGWTDTSVVVSGNPTWKQKIKLVWRVLKGFE